MGQLIARLTAFALFAQGLHGNFVHVLQSTFPKVSLKFE
jgi:hypothetical protein